MKYDAWKGIEQQVSRIVLASWFDSGADLLPVGQTHTFGVQTVPLVAVASPNLIDGICTGICSILLFISSLKLFHQCSIFPVVAFCFYIYFFLLPSTPKRLTRFACFCGFAAGGDKVRCKMETKEELPQGFSWLFSGTVSLKSFV